MNLIFLNVAVFVVFQVLGAMNPEWQDFFTKYFLLWKNSWVIDRGPAGALFLPVQWVTSMFAHGSILHLGMNMMALYFMGGIVEMVLGSKRFLELYLFAGLFSTVVLSIFDPSPFPVLGASCAISSLMVVLAIYFPQMKMRMLFPPITMTARTMAIVFAGVGILLFVLELTRSDVQTGISHFGHLMGMLAGLIFMQRDKIRGIFGGKK